MSIADTVARMADQVRRHEISEGEAAQLIANSSNGSMTSIGAANLLDAELNAKRPVTVD